MPEFIITAPDGTKYRVTGPEGATEEDALAQVQAQHGQPPPAALPQPGTKEYEKAVLSKYAKADPSQYDPGTIAQRASPLNEMSALDKLRAGWGMGVTNLGRGVGERLGMVSQQGIKDSRALDAPLASSGLGATGNILGSTATLLPLAFAPGANTLLGSAAIGAGTGFLQPSESNSETLKNTVVGGAIAPATILAGRAIGAGYNLGKSMLEPFTRGGQERIAARTLQNFAGGGKAAQEAADAIAAAAPTVPGVEPTAAEIANNAGIAQLERTLKNNPEFLPNFAARAQGNRGAIVGALDQIAGDDAALAAAKGARLGTTKPLYKAAEAETAVADDELRSLLNRPSMEAAWARAQRLAKEAGDVLKIGKDVPEQTVASAILDEAGKPFTSTTPAQNSSYSAKALQYLKMGLDDITNEAKAQGIKGHEQRATAETLSALKDWMGKNVPGVRAADATYAELSKPINKMQVGQALRDKLLPALADYGGNANLNGNAFANALRNGDQTAARVLGRENARLADVMGPADMDILTKVGGALARRSNADNLGRAVGSNTAQNLISQNMVRQFLGPLGVPESMVDRAAGSSLLQSILRPAQFAGKLGEGRVLQKLADAHLDPRLAEELLRLQVGAQANPLIRNQALLGPLALGAYAAQQ